LAILTKISTAFEKTRVPNAFISSRFLRLKMAVTAALRTPAALVGPGQAIPAYP
jgi:hypothetical protein